MLRIVFGEKEIKNDSRIIHTLMVISKKILRFEMGAYDLKEIIWGRTDSTFAQLFALIFESQDQNIDYLNMLITKIVSSLAKHVATKIHDSPEGIKDEQLS